MHIQEIFNAMYKNHHYEYLAINKDMEVIEYSDRVIDYCDAKLLTGEEIDVYTLVPEFYGLEKQFEEIFNQKRQLIEIPQVSKGEQQYVNISVQEGRKNNKKEIETLIVLFENVTEYVRMYQRSIQDKNEKELLLYEVENKNKKLLISEAEAVAAEKAKDTFLSNVSHEIRTPLNAILGYVQLLQQSKDLNKDKKFLTIIENSSNSLLSIINDLLDFAKIKSGNFSIDPFETDFTKEIAEVAELFNAKIIEKNIDFITYIDPKIPMLIKVDAIRIKQIISNYLSNAIKFTHENGRISLNTTYDVFKKSLYIEVIDNGIGIRKENLEKVFDSFSQEDDSTARKYGGTGLGLSICKKLAEFMGGNVGLQSIENKGSTFKVEVPIEIIDKNHHLYEINIKIALFLSDNFKFQNELLINYLDDMGANYIILKDYSDNEYFDLLITTRDYIENFNIKKDKKIIILNKQYTNELNYSELVFPLNALKIKDAFLETKAEIPVESKRVKYNAKVLVAEDNKVNQVLITILLNKYGIDVEIANDGDEAVELFLNNEYDLVFMDYYMPNKDGIQATKEILEFERDKTKIYKPIIGLSGNVLEEDVDEFYVAGIEDYLIKPIDIDKLENILEKYLEK